MKFKLGDKVNTPYGPGVVRIALELTGEYVIEYEYTTTPKIFVERVLEKA